ILLSNSFPRIVTWFRQFFEEFGVSIIVTQAKHEEHVASLLVDTSQYFNPENKHDRRDALIFSVALTDIPKEGSLILCQEHKLSDAFEGEGYTVRKDIKQFVTEIAVGVSVSHITKPDIHRFNDAKILGALSPSFINFIKTA